MPALNLAKKIGLLLYTFAMSGIDYVQYVWEEIRNVSGKCNNWGDELSRIEPMPSEPTHTRPTSTGKINLRYMGSGSE